MTMQALVISVVGGLVIGILCFVGGTRAAASRQESFDLPRLERAVKSMSLLIPQVLIGNLLLVGTFIFMLSRDQHGDTFVGLLLVCSVAAVGSTALIFNVKRLAQREINRKKAIFISNNGLKGMSQ